MRLQLATLALTCAIAASPSLAHGWRAERARLIAEAVWHRPCAGAVHVGWALAAPELGEEEEESAGLAILPGGEMAMADPGTCTIALVSPFLEYWRYYCVAVLHEYGHLAGYRNPSNRADPFHSRNPFSIMYYGAEYDPRCEDRGRPYLESIGVLRQRTPAR